MTERYRILAPYTRKTNDLRHRLGRIAIVTLLILVAMVMGFWIAILPVRLITIPLIPVFLLAALAFWTLPEADPRLDRAIVQSIFLFIIFTLVWPEYVAITIPGIGWAPFTRITFAFTVVASLYALSSSPRLRDEFKAVLTTDRIILYLLVGFIILQVLMLLAYARLPSRWIYALFFWYYLFVLGAWAFAHEGTARTFRNIILIGMAIQGLYSIGEFLNHNVLWANHIPPFMKVEDDLLSRIIKSSGYVPGVRGYRVHGVLVTPLTYAETMAVTLPFMVHALFVAPTWWRRTLALSLFTMTMVIIFAMTDVRSAVVGTVIAIGGYPALWALRRFRTAAKTRDLLGSITFWGYPFGAAMLMGLILSSHTLYVRTFGGAQHRASNMGREIQWDLTVAQFKSNPIGVGPFRAGGTIGYVNRGRDSATVDGYHMNMLVEYGVLGLVFFFGFFLMLLYLAVRTAYRSETEEEQLALPLAVALVSFLIIRTVLSQDENFTLVYLMSAMVLGLTWRQQQRLAGKPDLGPLPKRVRRRGILTGAGQAVPAE